MTTTLVPINVRTLSPLVAKALITADRLLAGCPPKLSDDLVLDSETVVSLHLKFDGKTHVKAGEEDLIRAKNILNESRRRAMIVRGVKRIETIRAALSMADDHAQCLVPVEEIAFLTDLEGHLS